jgi:hypothetical protein
MPASLLCRVLCDTRSLRDTQPLPYTKAPPLLVAIYDWTSFYIGARGGYASGRRRWDYLGPQAGWQRRA